MMHVFDGHQARSGRTYCQSQHEDVLEAGLADCCEALYAFNEHTLTGCYGLTQIGTSRNTNLSHITLFQNEVEQATSTRRGANRWPP